MSEQQSPSSTVSARFLTTLSSAPDATTSVSPVVAEVQRPKATSLAGRDGRVRDLLDHSVGEKAVATDPRTRKDWAKFTQLVERTLVTFESSNEWADFSTFLSKLLKCLQTFPYFTFIPHKLIVSKRLAQCLNPALPAGVHQRALDVYVHILNTIGPDNLRRDLQLWSSGLFPFFQYAATSVRPIMLGIYAKFYIPLQEHLRPATKALILALLPGLEEATGESFERVAGLLDQLSGTVSPAFFFQNMWLVLITAPSFRAAALNYLSRRMPKIYVKDTVAKVVGDDVGLMVRAFASALLDTQVLVQRATLDLINATLPLKGMGFQQEIRRAEQIILMKAMSTVVLRKDLSLSRRVYTWLLGTSEDSMQQIEYFTTCGLDLLQQSLLEDIRIATNHDAADTTSAQRALRIIISLMDKWEISFPLLSGMTLGMFREIELLLSLQNVSNETTISMLVDSIDPFIMWKSIHNAARQQLTDPSEETKDIFDLIAFIIHTFRMTDDEVTRLHGPLLAFSLIDTVAGSLEYAARWDDALMAITIAHALLKESAPSIYVTPSAEHAEDAAVKPGLQTAVDFYSATYDKSARIPASGFARKLLVAAYSTLLSLISHVRMAQEPNHELLVALLQSLTFMTELSPSDHSVPLTSSLSAWSTGMAAFVADLEVSLANFELLDSIVSCLLALDRVMEKSKTASCIHECVLTLADSLLDYLGTDVAACHAAASSLLWALEDGSGRRYIESALCQRMASSSPDERVAGFEAFGALWRCTEDAHLPGARLESAVHIMLDSLRSDDLTSRRCGEGWMRCSLKSYVRVLDPLLLSLLQPQYSANPVIHTLHGIDLHLLQYDRRIDAARMRYVLQNVANLASFGGQGFTRAAKITTFSQTPSTKLRERAEARGLLSENCLDGLCRILLDILRSRPAADDALHALREHRHILAAALDLLQLIVSRDDLETHTLQDLRVALEIRLYLCIHENCCDLQNKCLHALHSVLAATASRIERKGRQRSSSLPRAETSASTRKQILSVPENFLLRTMSDAITLQENSAILHHWIDFLLMTLPHLREGVASFALALGAQISGRLLAMVNEMAISNDPQRKGKEPSVLVSDSDFTVLVNAQERLFTLAAEDKSLSFASSNESTKTNSSEKTTTGEASAGILGFIGNALGGTDAPVTPMTTTPENQSPLHQAMSDFVNIVLRAWQLATEIESAAMPLQTVSHAIVAKHIRMRSRKALDRLYKAHSSLILGIVIETWVTGAHSATTTALAERCSLMELVDMLSPAPQAVASMLCDWLSAHSPQERGKSQAIPPDRDECVRYAFLYAFIARLSDASAVQIWPSFQNFVKDVSAAPQLHKYRLLPTLRCFANLGEKIAATNALEDKRMRREIHDAFIKLVDATLQLSGRLGDGLRRPAIDYLNNASQTLQLLVENGGADSTASSLVAEKERAGTGNQVADGSKDLASFFSRGVIPVFRLLSIDNDRLAATCANIVYYIVAPAFKTRSKALDVDDSVLAVLSELTKVPAALKSWRTHVLEVFSDNRFFYGPPGTSNKWRDIIQALIASDKERFADLISKISAATSANIFANREYESLTKSMAIRRLSYTILCGERNRYLAQLPAIQEKVVELLRVQVSNLVHSEVYLCLRVLLCRIDNQHLASFWPIILSELLRLFESLINDSPHHNTQEYLQLILSACKFLDLLLVLQTEEFQIHQWMFITDSVDAAYPPSNWTPQAIMDKLGEIISSQPNLLQSDKTPATIGTHPSRPDLHARLSIVSLPTAASLTAEGISAGSLRPTASPMLGHVRLSKISTAASSLEPFFSRASLSNYESVYALGEVDWVAVEASIACDIFEGDD